MVTYIQTRKSTRCSFIWRCFLSLHQTAEDNKENFNPVTVETVKCNFYVDNCLKSVESEEQAIQLQSELQLVLARGGFRLTK